MQAAATTPASPVSDSREAAACTHITPPSHPRGVTSNRRPSQRTSGPALIAIAT